MFTQRRLPDFYLQIMASFNIVTGRPECRPVSHLCRPVKCQKLKCISKPTLLGRPEQPFRTGLCFTADISVFSPRIFRGPSTDRPETLPHDQNLAVVYNPTPKIRGALPPKNWGPKTCKISVDFGPLQTFIANISGTARDI